MQARRGLLLRDFPVPALFVLALAHLGLGRARNLGDRVLEILVAALARFAAPRRNRVRGFPACRAHQRALQQARPVGIAVLDRFARRRALTRRRWFGRPHRGIGKRFTPPRRDDSLRCLANRCRLGFGR